ncbi:hypothetical protein PCANC_18618 [Puccinia coronata f. sp. avenae]|uniref:Uncharacterized protein n=1 Tax=Puccinia coronata f. sp. avenae TaxID=200324 RepID=A0A2N5UHN5_9BASI|nr:hypothetical protein PCANC_18618 [Puccinia coronata f. sp. avenae]
MQVATGGYLESCQAAGGYLLAESSREAGGYCQSANTVAMHDADIIMQSISNELGQVAQSNNSQETT